jgi:catechol 2,3-dioxygenase-like lactoylglutathione lyase family enzyme
MRRFHIALAVADLAESIRDYSRRLGAAPTAVVTGKYAMWRTDQLNFSINQMPERAGQLRHLAFEDEDAAGFSSDRDVNDIEWELFSPTAQDEKIVEIYGALANR